MSYGWWKFIHLVGVVGFVAAHGTSMAATVLMRRIHEPQQVSGILQLSAATVDAFYSRPWCSWSAGSGRGSRGNGSIRGGSGCRWACWSGWGYSCSPWLGGISAASGWCSS